MSTPELPYPMGLQEAVISANLNSSMLLNYMIGIYTMIYAGTVYLYMSKRTANINRCIVLSALTVLYLLCFLGFLEQWYFLDLAVVIHGDTRESMFLSTLEGGPSRWISPLNDSLFYSMFIVSDGLLIWRCYHVWGQSFQVISAPLIFLVAELGLCIAATVLAVLFTGTISDSSVALFNNISSALIFVSLATTVITTCLIGYKIHSASHLNGLPSKRLFSHTVVLVIESAAAYSITLFVYAILSVVPSFSELESPLLYASFYVQVVVIIVAGLAPTVLVARVALTSPNNKVALTVTHISGLQFQSQQASGYGGIGNRGEGNISIQTGYSAPAPVGEVKESSVNGTSGGYEA